MRMIAAGNRIARRDNEGRTIPPVCNDSESGLGNATVRNGKTRVSRWLLIVRVARVMPAEIVCYFLCPDLSVPLEIPNRDRAILDGPSINVRDAAGKLRSTTTTARSHGQQMSTGRPAVYKFQKE